MAIVVEELSYSYGRKGIKPALQEISLRIEAGEFAVISGPTGSGKSTLLKHFNGLLRPEAGRVTVDGLEAQQRKVREKVGMLFQHPHDQLFAENVFQEIAFGPSNFGILGRELEERVYEALFRVQLDPGILDRSPFCLSGGEMRRIALAGVLALRPDYLVLDEPTAGLDPLGRAELLNGLSRIHKSGTGIIVVAHHLEEVLPFAEKVILLKEGRLEFSGSRQAYLEAGYSPLPPLTELLRALNGKGAGLREDVYTVDGAVKELLKIRNAAKGSR